MASSYWMVSAPNESGQASSSAKVRDKFLLASSALDSLAQLRLPNFRVGTLDSLMSVSDALAKDEKSLESSVERLIRQMRELPKSTVEFSAGSARPSRGKDDSSPIAVDEKDDLHEYLAHFEWDEARFSLAEPMDEIRSNVVAMVTRLEEELKIRAADYTAVKQSRSAIERRSHGNLMARSLAAVVSAEHVMETEHMTTAFVVVPSFSEKEFLDSYEALASLVVPRSAIRIAADNEYVLFGVTLFKKGFDDFRAAAREKRFTVRDFKFDPNEQESNAEELTGLVEEEASQAASFRSWAETAVSEAIIASIHLKVIRVFVESVLRFGLPVNFEVSLMRPAKRMESRVRSALIELFGYLGGKWASEGGGGGDGETTMIPGVTSTGDFHPYVFVDIPIAE